MASIFLYPVLSGKRYLNTAELQTVITLVKLRYPHLMHLDNRIITGIAITESGKTLNGQIVVDNQAYRAGGGIDYSLGIMQLIKPTAEGLKKQHTDLPALTTYEIDRRVYRDFINPFISLAYGMTLLNDNYSRYKSINDSIKAYNAGSPQHPAGDVYLSKVLKNMEQYA